MKHKITWVIQDHFTDQWLSSLDKGEDRWDGVVDPEEDVVENVKNFPTLAAAQKAKKQIIKIFKKAGVPDSDLDFRIYEIEIRKITVQKATITEVKE